MSPREERGLVIAALTKLNCKNGDWFVPSQSNDEKNYRVNPVKQTCTCPDHQETGFVCKHLYAVQFTIKRECNADGSVTETKSMTFTEKKTYTQVWPAYNKAQSIEKDRMQELLFDLYQQLEVPKHDGHGREPHSIRDVVFALVLTSLSTQS